MSRETPNLTGAAVHERARMLAAESVDMPLDPGDEAWLTEHLEACPDCAAVAADYRAIHLELRSLPAPEPPRDLWARTSAGLDMVDAAAARRSPSAGRAAGPGRRPLFTTAVAVVVVVVVAVGSLLVQSPVLNPAPGSTPGSNVALGTASPAGPSSAPQGPLAVVNGTSYWIASSGGIYQIKGGSTQCSATDGSCTVATGSGQTLGSIKSDSDVSAVIAPGAQSAAVWTDDKVAIVPLTVQPQTIPLDQLTPRPTIAATPTAVATPATTVTATPAATTIPEATRTATAPTATPQVSSVSSGTPAPSATPAKTATPTAMPTAVAATTQPTAILTGHEIVGRDPEFSADGSEVAFSARPVDHGAGPDVFVWRSGQEQATRVTNHHADLFAGWYGHEIIISEISAVAASGGAAASSSADAPDSASFAFDTVSGAYLKIDRPMLLPVVDPTSKYLVYWSGSVEFDPVSGLWEPGGGDLYFDTWANLKLTPAPLQSAASPGASPTAAATATPSPAAAATPGATQAVGPSAAAFTAEPSPAATATSSHAAGSLSPDGQTLPQLLPVAATPGTVHSWIVRWDAAGQHVAIWVADPNGSSVGRLWLYSIDRTTGQVDTNLPLLSVSKVMSNIAFDAANLVYTSAIDGRTYMQAVPAVPPSSASTPVPTAPGQQPSGPATGTAQATDRPGN
jgi:hypothetical protein